MEDTAGTIIEQLARWADAMTRTLAAWDTGTLIVLAVTLTVLAGVTGRATTGGGLIRQILWITVTAILTLIAVATVWTIASRYLPIPELEMLLRNLAGHQPLFVAGLGERRGGRGCGFRLGGLGDRGLGYCRCCLG